MKQKCSRPKGEQIIAQGSSPGNRCKSRPPCKGDRMSFVLQDGFVWLPSAYIGRPFTAIRQPGIPRAKALGCSLSPFRASLTPRGAIRTESSTPTFQYSNTAILRHAARQHSRTACPTQLKLNVVDRSSRPRKRGRLHNQHVGEVGRTTTSTRTRLRTPNAKRQAPNAYTP